VKRAVLKTIDTTRAPSPAGAGSASSWRCLVEDGGAGQAVFEKRGCCQNAPAAGAPGTSALRMADQEMGPDMGRYPGGGVGSGLGGPGSTFSTFFGQL
jgi:hypothetical protein